MNTPSNETTTTTEAPARKVRKIERTPLKSICGSLKIDPKAARRLLRKSPGLSFHGSRERWTFTEAQAEKVRELLKGSEIERKVPARKPARKVAAKPAAAPSEQPSA